MHRTAIAQTSVYTYGAGVDILKQNQGFPCVFQHKANLFAYHFIGFTSNNETPVKVKF